VLTASNPPGTSPVGRAAKGSSIVEVLLELDLLRQAGQDDFVAVTVLWRRILAVTDDDQAVARHQAALVHRLRRVLARRHVPKPLVLSVLENTTLHGTHGHLVAQCPAELHDTVLNAMEAGLTRRHGPLPTRAFNRDGWRHDGSIGTQKGVLGAVRYRLKSFPSAPVEHGVRRGVGLKPVEGITVRCSNGRPKPPARP
jgi:hypothetical protein